MSKDISVITVTGRLVKDPDMRFTTEGKPITSFTLAFNGYKEDDTSFIECTCFGKIAEVAGEYLVKGKQVLICGRLKIEKWQDKDQNNRQTPKIDVNELQMLGAKKEESKDSENDI